jgi:hypothetical protein
MATTKSEVKAQPSKKTSVVTIHIQTEKEREEGRPILLPPQLSSTSKKVQKPLAIQVQKLFT